MGLDFFKTLIGVYMKNISEEGYADFVKYFKINFPGLTVKFGGDIEWSFLNGQSGVTKPSDMSREDFDEFRRIEYEWLIENEYVVQYKGRPSFKLVVNGIADINTNTILWKKELTDNSTSICVKEADGKEYVFDVVGNIDWVNNKIRTVSGHE